MATRSSKPTQAQRFIDTEKSRLDSAARAAGITSLFEPAAVFGTQALELQQALAGGILRSQTMETARLSLRFGKKDPRVVQAESRVGRLQALKTEVDQHTETIGRVVETFRRDGTFSGYVVQPDGTPAQAYVVRVEVTDSATKQTRRGTAKTDATGFFSIVLSGDTRVDNTRKATDLQQLMERLVAQGLDTGPLGRGPDSATTTASTVTSRAEVMDPSGRVVFEDPVPPTFDELTSEFRIYALPSKAADQSSRRNRKTS